jgi:hypothetical protein
MASVAASPNQRSHAESSLSRARVPASGYPLTFPEPFKVSTITFPGKFATMDQEDAIPFKELHPS